MRARSASASIPFQLVGDEEDGESDLDDLRRGPGTVHGLQQLCFLLAQPEDRNSGGFRSSTGAVLAGQGIK